MAVQYERGDLLAQSADAIVNTVNCVGVMGKGIALQFRKKWPANFKAYAAACESGELRIGNMFVFDCGGLLQPNFIINFPTKNHWREKTKISYIDDGLADLAQVIRKLGIRSIAIPPLGCGNGGLLWSDVRRKIENAFSELSGVQVFLFEPMGAPDAREMVVNTEKPRMTAGRAAMIRLFSIYRELEYSLGSIEIQKLAYFLEASGYELNLNFTKHNFGPYSAKIRHVLTAMDGHYIKGAGDGTTTSSVNLLPNALGQATSFLKQSGDNYLQSNIDKVAELIEGFETPYGMELLATVHWVVAREPKARNLDETIAAVEKWSHRKKKLLQQRHIKIAWARLGDLGWFENDTAAISHS